MPCLTVFNSPVSCDLTTRIMTELLSGLVGKDATPPTAEALPGRSFGLGSLALDAVNFQHARYLLGGYKGKPSSLPQPRSTLRRLGSWTGVESSYLEMHIS